MYEMFHHPIATIHHHRSPNSDKKATFKVNRTHRITVRFAVSGSAHDTCGGHHAEKIGTV